MRPEARLLETERKLLPHADWMSAYNSESARSRLLGPLRARFADDDEALLPEASRDGGDLRCVDGQLEFRPNPSRHLAAPALSPLAASSSTTPRPPTPGMRWSSTIRASSTEGLRQLPRYVRRSDLPTSFGGPTGTMLTW